MDDKHRHTLEFPKVLERLARFTSFAAGADKARRLRPTPFLAEVRQRLETTTEARALLESHPPTSLGGARDIRPHVKTARRGATLTPTDLLDVRSTLVAAQRLHQTLSRLRPQFPRLYDIATRIAPCPDLVTAIDRCLDEQAQVRDGASPLLAKLRREMRLAHSRLQERLRRIVAAQSNAPFLQESIVTMRDGRYVIPLKADFKGRIKGIVHDRSASGATLFIEPLHVVELNNAWRELQIQEEQEVQRILAELSALVATHSSEIEHTVDALADLDLALAQARYAEELHAVPPTLPDHPGPRSTVSFLQARHPLLDPETVVPIDVVLDDETRILVITGPNTGGKTVTLKTVGLLTLMAQSGLHIPAAPGSALVPFETVYADIGDEQSIEQSLSTFSSHLSNILSFIDRADEHSLVLLDELGAGTDPAEGSALARAFLETLLRQGATVFVATHYPELKAFAQLTPGVVNGSVEFDPQTLRPTYRLTIGLPGRSNAFSIATRLGLPAAITDQARAYVSEESLTTEDWLNEINSLRQETLRANKETLAARETAETAGRKLESRLAGIEKERREIMEAARAEAREELAQVRREIRRLRHQMATIAAAQEPLRQIEGRIQDLDEQVEPPPPPPRPQISRRRPLEVGDTVLTGGLGTNGEVLSISENSIEVQVGQFRVLVRPEDVELREGPAAISPSLTGKAISLPPPPSPGIELHLRGYRVADALPRLEEYLNNAFLAGLPWVRIVHGKGTGTLRQAVREALSVHTLVTSFRNGEEGEGGTGVTVVTLASK